ncbi:3-deoxy-D-manno-octulosonic acid transferase [Aquimixticola soesokkakensis]|uniref:3-deoxy-D-manno-octulosonic acid transferase n=1 Tax=Aquimixticola soesokkakensis TaxID=1519096 RepID=A0A1Y5TP88_9RHOB|nr:glycosyltransferase N-terminal domain-containing protein [Aquimixticola soesokkakensis]SLN68776.1 3-deoxy-D-manno-octulosonic acid transferase [Aquimixticola soesokkakensis]
MTLSPAFRLDALFSNRSDGLAARRLAQAVAQGEITKQEHDARLALHLPERPKGDLIWVHVSDPTSTPAVFELIDRLSDAEAGLSFLVTHAQHGVTAACARDVICQPLPIDRGPAVTRFLDHWAPSMCIWVGANIQPRLLAATLARKRQVFALDTPNATPLDASRGLFHRALTRAVLRHFDWTIIGDAASQKRWLQAGMRVEKSEVLGFIEEGASVPAGNAAERAEMAEVFGTRPLWLANHLAEGEDLPVLHAQKAALRRAHRLLAVIVPDDPDRGAQIARQAHDMGMTTARRALDEALRTETQIYIADTEGESGLWYRLCPISFLGQSLVNNGGIDPSGAAALGSGVLHGPNISDYALAYSKLASAGAARRVRSPLELAREIEALLSPDRVAAMAHAAWEVTSAGADVTNRIVSLVIAARDAEGES